MSSQGFVSNAVALTATDPILVLLTIEHADLAEPIRLVRNNANIVSRGETFTAFPFDLTLPGSSDGGSSPARIVIDNVDQTIWQTIRAIATPPTLLIEVVLASAPNVVEESLPIFKLTSASADRFSVEATLADSAEDESEPLVQWELTPSVAPALHN